MEKEKACPNRAGEFCIYRNNTSFDIFLKFSDE